MSDLYWALLMGAIAMVQSLRAECHVRESIRAKAALKDSYNNGLSDGSEADDDRVDEGQAAWREEALLWRGLIEADYRKHHNLKEVEHE